MKYLLIITIIISSCKKQTIEQEENVESSDQVFKISIMNTWQLTNAWIYFENIETGQKIKYDHFSPTKDISSIRHLYPWHGIETIEQGVTTWEFTHLKVGPSIYEFVLNHKDTMAVKLSEGFKSIIEHPQSSNSNNMHLGGSAKPFQAWTEDGVNLKISIHDAYTSINNMNYNYFNILEFKPQ